MVQWHKMRLSYFDSLILFIFYFDTVYVQGTDLHRHTVACFDIHPCHIDGAVQHADGTDNTAGLAADLDRGARRLEHGFDVRENSTQAITLAASVLLAADIKAVVPADRHDGKLTILFCLPNGAVACALTFSDMVQLVNLRLHKADRAQLRLKRNSAQKRRAQAHAVKVHVGKFEKS